MGSDSSNRSGSVLFSYTLGSMVTEATRGMILQGVELLYTTATSSGPQDHGLDSGDH
ncbi:hypothetical protein DY000_02034268 [Brassica cretica]|uniref:Uncharacterized protein n=1 Tax=Brassica cretica TaxID=69181 RepID=A0ABQ7DKW2_BRACR|nr:hypothetical protein DY000_02034268 [Brassica cretica]